MSGLNFPDSPSPGEIFDDWQWDGSKWVQVPSPPAAPPVTVSSTPPANPVQGQLWWNDDTGQLNIYYVDANSSQWVQANVGLIGPPGPAGAPGSAGPPGPNVMPPGVTDGSNATAGHVGEYLQTTMPPGTWTTFTSGWQVLLTLALTAGDWDCWGFATFTGVGGAGDTVFSSVSVGVSLAATPQQPSVTQGINMPGIGAGTTMPTTTLRVSTATAVTLNLIVNVVFTSGTAAATRGFVAARRVR